MNIPRDEIIYLGEYTITIDYDGVGGLDILVFDELGEEVEGLFISDDDNNDIGETYVDPRLN